jgi:hypothetical protein
VGGFEPNVGFATWAREHLDGARIDVAEFPHVPGTDWDVALSCYALAYADPDVVRETLEKLGPRTLVLIEPTAYVQPYHTPGLYGHVAMPHYAHDYLTLLHDTGWRTLWRWPLYPHRHGLNVVTVAERASQ